MPSYTVTAASLKKALPDKNAQVITLGLQEYGQEPIQAEWYQAPAGALPAVGSKLEGSVEPGKFGGLDFKTPRKFGGGGGGRAKTPEERRSIAMQSSGQRGSEIVCALIQAGLWKPSSADDAAQAALRIANQFYAAVQRAEAGK